MGCRLAGSTEVEAQVTAIGNVVPASERSKSSVRAPIGDLLSIEERHEDVAPDEARPWLARSNRIEAPCSVAAASRTYSAHGEAGISNGDRTRTPAAICRTATMSRVGSSFDPNSSPGKRSRTRRDRSGRCWNHSRSSRAREVDRVLIRPRATARTVASKYRRCARFMPGSLRSPRAWL